MFSIVIPLYNKAHTIEGTLQSIFSQTYVDYEIIIVNDGSTDNGIDIIKSYSSDARIKIYEQNNKGVSVARNKGVECANYNYIAFIDGDDKWLPDYLMKIKEAIDLYPNAGMFCCAGSIKNPEGTYLRIAEKYKGKIQKINFFENPHVFVHTSSTVVLKNKFIEAGGFPVGMVRNEDYALFFSLALITPVVYCGIPLSIYVGGVHGQATSTSIDKVLTHVVERFNHVFKNWLNVKPKNMAYIVFMKYEIRSMIIFLIRINDYRSINYFLKNLDPAILKFFNALEISLYRNKRLSLLSFINIIITKLRWRIRGYPILKLKLEKV